MWLSQQKMQQLSKAIEHLTLSHDCSEVRQQVGYDLLELLDADYYASFIWDQQRSCFRERVSINMDAANLQNYEHYFQHHDPITHKLQRYQSTVPVRAVMPQKTLVKTEFYNDFLKRDGLHYGINLYAHDHTVNIGDIRIWRAKNRPDFSSDEIALLDLIKPCFINAMRNIKTLKDETSSPIQSILVDSIATQITARENDVLLGIINGSPDKVIARELGISFSTVRTHINRLFQKLEVSNRTELVRRVSSATFS
ncbi:MAG: LuxR C-terminal-related transcriptional regulator [Sedimenticola sp.]|nr:LuxR C-terminal-related transcriptional regulator [Sedimenticola sp.]